LQQVTQTSARSKGIEFNSLIKREISQSVQTLRNSTPKTATTKEQHSKIKNRQYMNYVEAK